MQIFICSSIFEHLSFKWFILSSFSTISRNFVAFILRPNPLTIPRLSRPNKTVKESSKTFVMEEIVRSCWIPPNFSYTRNITLVTKTYTISLWNNKSTNSRKIALTKASPTLEVTGSTFFFICAFVQTFNLDTLFQGLIKSSNRMAAPLELDK